MIIVSPKYTLVILVLMFLFGAARAEAQTDSSIISTIRPITSLGSGLFGSFSGSGSLFGGVRASSFWGGDAKNIYGGKITLMKPCTCPYNLPPAMAVTITGPKGGTFLLTPLVKTYSYGRPVTGQNVMGEYSPVSVCWMVTMCGKVPCCPMPPSYPVNGTIKTIATS